MLTHPAGCRPSVRNRPLITRVAYDPLGLHILSERGHTDRSAMRPWLVSMLVLLLLCSIAPTASAQLAVSPLAGVVVDPSAAPIAGAIVTVFGEGRTTGTQVVTDIRGGFQIDLSPGTYTITVKSDGFVETSRVVTVPLDRPRPLEFALALAGLHETVAVTATPGEAVSVIRSATKTPTPLLNVPQSVTIVSEKQIQDQLMTSMGDVMRYVPGVTVHQGENNRDQIIIRGNSTSADFFVDGVRDDVQYYRDLYNLSRVEVLKGPNALIFGRGGAGGVVNRVGKEAGLQPLYEASFQAGTYASKRATTDLDQPVTDKVAVRLNA